MIALNEHSATSDNGLHGTGELEVVLDEFFDTDINFIESEPAPQEDNPNPFYFVKRARKSPRIKSKAHKTMLTYFSGVPP